MKIQKELKPIDLNFWLKDIPHFNFEQFYLRKIKNMKISKIKEFLFKMIHTICICNDVNFWLKDIPHFNFEQFYLRKIKNMKIYINN